MGAGNEIRPTDVVVELPPALAAVALALRAVRVEKAEVAERERALVENLQAALGENGTVGTVDGHPVVTWREHATNRLDSKALRADNPELADKYMKAGSSRRFEVVE
ncbi:hypothetical protein SEA_MULCH_45 [Gordonia phage Mulch]|uniref:Uncharacterized protein n=6 Tax=Betterkatzvirus betterkatz TaxID=2560485 RepID=A0A2Z5HDV6_9CAUD|nr:hypothetical protein SEA_NADEEM_45 [Gordonia phage Nadeem]AZS11213.1 hypothetical protein PBI_WHEATTHIN_45 [Gordonia phage WheatThin]QAU06843.1 hypothetical protein SEA_BRYLIE_45 [Gordonia phage Brylie]QAX92541.1 hypothetical protein SEA_MULCH_45 [Gordonia phage Mulch]QAY06502.1 hypothetical protein SEA_PARADA_45 [Gordonia phage Parada]QPL13920.1 hypothetical protein SEA_NANCYRAE_45 [Gordonia phage NancyRae]